MVDDSLAKRGLSPRMTKRNKTVVVLVWVGIAAFILAILRQPADRVRIEPGGGMSVEQPDWWGFSAKRFELRLHDGQWQVRGPRGWAPYHFPGNEPPPDPRS